MDSFNLPDADVSLLRYCFDPTHADNLFLRLRKEILWTQEDVTFYGKKIPLPRLTAWYGESGAKYTYSNITNDPHPWTPLLLEIRAKVESVAGETFNSVLLNLYRSGRDGVGWHQDNEPELGERPVIASVSFGATRVFQMRHKNNRTAPMMNIALEHGSLLVMQGGCQEHWRHQIPRTATPCGERINLTFRLIHNREMAE